MRLPAPGLVASVALGGAIGAALRHQLGVLVPDGTGFPATTFAINVAGAFLLALLPAWAVVRRSSAMAVALGPGLLGGFTTLSAVSDQSRGLLAGDRPWLGLCYLGGTLLAAVLAVAIASSWTAQRERARFAARDGDT